MSEDSTPEEDQESGPIEQTGTDMSEGGAHLLWADFDKWFTGWF